MYTPSVVLKILSRKMRWFVTVQYTGQLRRLLPIVQKIRIIFRKNYFSQIPGSNPSKERNEKLKHNPDSFFL